MIKSEEYILCDKQEVDLVRLKVGDLFNDQQNHTTDDIYEQAKELGLELRPAEVGPYLRLNYKDQPPNEYIVIAMKQITDADGHPGVFYVGRDIWGKVWLYYGWAGPTLRWDPDDPFVFRLRKGFSETLSPSDALPLTHFDAWQQSRSDAWVQFAAALSSNGPQPIPTACAEWADAMLDLFDTRFKPKE